MPLFAILGLLALGLMAFAPAGPALQREGEAKVIFGANYTLKGGETLDSDLVALGSNVVLQKDSLVRGDVLVLGGNLQVQGRVQGDVAVLGGLLNLGPHAVVEGDVTALGARYQRAKEAQVYGEEITQNTFPAFGGPSTWRSDRVWTTTTHPLVALFWGVLWWLGRAFLWAALALLVTLFIPRPVERTAQAALAQPAPALGLGCLTILVVPILLLLLAITICGIPFALLGGLALFAAWALGIIALGQESGKRLAALLKQEWAPAVSAALGTFLLMLILGGIGSVVPCVGWLVPFIVGLLGLGAALITRYGSQDYASVIAPARPPSPPSTTPPTPPSAEELPPPAPPPGEESANEAAPSTSASPPEEGLSNESPETPKRSRRKRPSSEEG